MPKRNLYHGKTPRSIQVAEKPLPFKPEIKSLSIHEFNKIMSEHRNVDYHFAEEVYTTDATIKSPGNNNGLIDCPTPDSLVICWINNTVGYGVYTTKDIAKDTPIAIYTGELSRRVGMKQSAYALGALNDQTSVCFIEGQKQSGIASFIQAAPPKEEYYQLINYPLQTCNLTHQHIQIGDITLSLLIAAEDIPAGSQLLFDYGVDYWDALASTGIIERAFSQNNHCETPPARLFIFSDELTIPSIIYLLETGIKSSIDESRMLKYLAQCHRELFNLLPSNVHSQLKDFIEKQQRQFKPLRAFIQKCFPNDPAERKLLLECYDNKLSALSVADTFKPSKTSQPAYSDLTRSEYKLSPAESANKKAGIQIQLQAAQEADLHKACELYTQALKCLSSLLESHCPTYSFGNTKVVIDRAIYNIHLQLMRTYKKLNYQEKVLHHSFICRQLYLHPNIQSTALEKVANEVDAILEESFRSYSGFQMII